MTTTQTQSEKPKVIADIGSTAQAAFKNLSGQLPYPVDHEAYAVFKKDETELEGGRYLVTINYVLKPGFKDPVVTKGRGAYQTDMEKRFGGIRL